MATHYETLGVAPGATHDEIRRAYYGLARRHHPDAHSQASPAVQDAARRVMVGINASWDVLGDPRQRRLYDAEIAPRPRRATPRQATDGVDEPTGRAGFPDWFEPDDEVPAYQLPEDPYDGARRPLDLLMLVPVGLAALAAITFVFGMLLQSSALLSVTFLLVPLSLLGFLAAPLLTIARMRSGPNP